MKSSILVAALLSAIAVVSVSYASEQAPVVEKQSCEKAVYPKSALINEETGTVVLSVLVAADGNVLESKVEQSSGSKTLDKAAAKIYSSCKFKPGAKDGKPFQTWVKLEHIWSLS
ncbi:MAG: energy transducer TonB [Undibacterium sp.]|nr:energy transducer TonB [Undibacterium sp.]